MMSKTSDGTSCRLPANFAAAVPKRHLLCESERKDDVKAPRSTGKLVLIVDDDPDARQILGGIVRALGLNTTVTSSGKEALDAIRNNPPDLVLLDLMMPGMDGFEVLFRLRSIPSTRHVPVIVVSAYSVGQQDLLRLPGVAEVIKKGQFEIVELQKSVSSILKPPTAAFST